MIRKILAEVSERLGALEGESVTAATDEILSNDRRDNIDALRAHAGIIDSLVGAFTAAIGAVNNRVDSALTLVQDVSGMVQDMQNTFRDVRAAVERNTEETAALRTRVERVESQTRQTV